MDDIIINKTYHNNKNNILNELIYNQLKNISDNKLLLSDFKRISDNLNISIFTDKCSLWLGNVSNINDKNYINFHLNRKKKSLHRILYSNYIGNITDHEYIKFKCSNKGLCCTISHFYKINPNIILNDIIEPIEPINNTTNNKELNKIYFI